MLVFVLFFLYEAPPSPSIPVALIKKHVFSDLVPRPGHIRACQQPENALFLPRLPTREPAQILPHLKVLGPTRSCTKKAGEGGGGICPAAAPDNHFAVRCCQIGGGKRQAPAGRLPLPPSTLLHNSSSAFWDDLALVCCPAGGAE